MISTKMTTLLAVGFFSVTGLSAMAAPKAVHHQAKVAVVAQAEGTTPAADAAKPQKKAKSKGTKEKGKDKGAATDATPAPAPEKMPEKK
jgi:hypothetical protein